MKNILLLSVNGINGFLLLFGTDILFNNIFGSFNLLDSFSQTCSMFFKHNKVTLTDFGGVEKIDINPHFGKVKMNHEAFYSLFF